MSQMDTADAAKMSLNRFWRIENGYVEATAEERAALAGALDASESDAFPEAVAS
jgi:transcriptional regulator with XRE-family HTH domain